MTTVSNPFITTGYQGAAYFCNRETETRILLENLENGRSTTLTAIRRMGKTGLVRHVLDKLPDEHAGIYMDILPTENSGDFFNTLASAIFNAIHEQSGPGKKIMDFIKSLRPVITYDPLTGHPQVTIDVRPEEMPRHVGSVLRLLEGHPGNVVIAIDEFQQILHYPEKNVDAWLRSIIQSLSNVHFIFAGSQQHLMDSLFADPSRPFYQSTGILRIGKIEKKTYASFITGHFIHAGKQITREVALEMLEWADVHTYYVQLICNRVFARETDRVTSDTWKEEASGLLQEYETIFFKYRDLLTRQQWNLLKAIAYEGEVYFPTSKDFIAKFSLGSPATVLRSLQALQKKEMIYSEYNRQGKLFYHVYDVLFRRWIQGHQAGF